MDIAIITGASSGLGAEFVRQIDRKEELDAIWGVARRGERLQEMGKEIQCLFRVMHFPLASKKKNVVAGALFDFSELVLSEKPLRQNFIKEGQNIEIDTKFDS